jgi:hypothetical protein
LLGRLTARLQTRTALSAFATLLLVAILGPALYERFVEHPGFSPSPGSPLVQREEFPAPDSAPRATTKPCQCRGRSSIAAGFDTAGDATWFGVGVPRNTPVEIVNKLNYEINEALADPKMKARLAELGGTPLPGSPADFGKFIAAETEKWGKVIRAANIKAE